MINKTDQELLEFIQKKNKRAFKLLFMRYEMMIFNFILKYCGSKELAQDLLQETFTKIWFHANQFDPSRGQSKNWIFTIALNTTRNEMVKKRYTVQHDPIQEESEQWANTDSDDHSKITMDDLQRLKPEYREMLILKHYENYTFRELSEMLNEPESTLKSRFQKALKELKAMMMLEEER